MTEWQPIETAPKDGTWIFVTHKVYGTLVISKWEDEQFIYIHNNWPQPSHWMHFPKLPNPNTQD